MKSRYRSKMAIAALLGILGFGCQSLGDWQQSLTTPESPAHNQSGVPRLVPSNEASSGQLTASVVPVQFRIDEELANPSVHPEQIELHAGELPPPPPKPVEHYVQLALANHPRIRAARARVAAAAQRIPQASALEDPVLVNMFWPIPDAALQTADGRAVNDLRISQEVPWPGKRSTRAAVANRETRMAMAQLSQARLEIEEAVRLAYYELWFADRAMAITEENRQIGVELIALAEARNRAGGSQQDILRAQLQLDAIDNRLIELRQQKALAQADLAALILRPGMEDVEPTDQIEISDVPRRLDALIAAAEQCSPRLQERSAAVSRERQEVRLARLGQYPDLMVGAGWMAMTTDDALSTVATGTDTVNFMVGLTLPIWRGRINASIREASAELTAASRDYDDAQNDVVRQLRRLKEQAVAADQQLRLYEERILPRTRQTLQLSSADYRGQLIGFGEVVDNFTELLMFELQAARAHATLAGTLAQIDRIVGCEFLALEE